MAHGKMPFVLKAEVALIGGTGIGERLALLGGRAVNVPTPFGMLRGQFATVAGRQVFVVRRHSAGHKLPPHRVRYEGIADGLRRLGVRFCFSSAAVGSLRDDWPIGTFASCTDFLDFSGRGTTLFANNVVHTDCSVPFPASGMITGDHSPCVYACMNGPRYETPQEIVALRALGADVVGMTVASEAIVMREAGIAYGCLAVVTNLACGVGDAALSHEEVGDAMSIHGRRAVETLMQAVEAV